MAYEQLKPVLRKYQVIAPELLNEIQKCAWCPIYTTFLITQAYKALQYLPLQKL
jgi:hypothetical protein